MKEWVSFAHTSIGFSHIASNKVCQDYSRHHQDDTAVIAVVSDGHGSDNFTRSDRGSKYACDSAIEAVTEFLHEVDKSQLEDDSQRDSIVTQLCKNIILRWNERVEADASNQPFTEGEVEKVKEKYRVRYLNGTSVEHAYGCTLLIAIVTESFCLFIRNGDGECVTIDNNGELTTPIPWNENCEVNVTTSLCDDEAIKDFRYYYSSILPLAVFIGSDGVDNSYAAESELLHLYRVLCLKIVNDGPKLTIDFVKELLPELTKRGSADDVSIAGVFNAASLQNVKLVLEAAVESRRLRLEQENIKLQKRIIEKDIKVAERDRSRASERLLNIQKRRDEVENHRTSIFEQLSIFKKKADDLQEQSSSLRQEEDEIMDIVKKADEEIENLKRKLLDLDHVTEAESIPDAHEELHVQEEIISGQESEPDKKEDKVDEPCDTKEASVEVTATESVGDSIE